MTKKEKDLLNELSMRTDDFLRFCRKHRIPAYVMTEPEGIISEGKRIVRFVTPDECNLCMSNDNVIKLMLMGNQDLRLSPIKHYQNEIKNTADEALENLLTDEG